MYIDDIKIKININITYKIREVNTKLSGPLLNEIIEQNIIK